MDNDGKKEANKTLADLWNLPNRELFHFDGWGYDGITIKFATQEDAGGRRIESTISVRGGMFKSSEGNTVIRVVDTEYEVSQDPDKEFGPNMSHASLVLRFSETQYGNTYGGQHMFSGVLTEALTYGKDVQEKLDYGTPLEEILYSEDDPLELNPPDAGVLAHLVGQHAWIILYQEKGFLRDDYEPRRSLEEDLREEEDRQDRMRLEAAEHGE